jgi:hypothetical protein
LLIGVVLFNLAQSISNAPSISKQPIIITPDEINIEYSENKTHWNITSTFDNTTLKEGELYYIRFVLPVINLPFSDVKLD